MNGVLCCPVETSMPAVTKNNWSNLETGKIYVCIIMMTDLYDNALKHVPLNQ